MNVFLDMLGCRLNEAELQSWSRGFARAGCRVVPHAGSADLIVLNTCAVTGEAERKSRQHARRLHRESPTAHIVLTGCFSELDVTREGRTSLPWVDLVVRNAEKDRLVDLILERWPARVAREMPTAATEPGDPHVYRAARTRAFVKVQDGCRHRCTFCIVTIARGEERSRSPRELVDEINALERAGHREVVLTGVHLGGYGRDFGTTLRELVSDILRDTSVPRIRLSSLEPWDLPVDFFELWRDSRLMPHLHLPLQSGCDAVLRRMGRRCDVRSFRTLVEAARRDIEGLTVTTDIIVGFPGETDAEFAASLETLESIGFGHVHLFTYSPREGTAAARRPDQLPSNVKRERMLAARELTARMAASHRRRFLGSTRPVLWEEVEKLERCGVGETRHRWRGHTDNYLRVATLTPAGEALRHQIETVRLTHVVDGELVGERGTLGGRRLDRSTTDLHL